MRCLGLLFFAATVALFLAAGAAYAGECAILASGGRLRVDRHETDGVKVRLYRDGGFVEMDAASVSGYEPDEEPVFEKKLEPVAADPAPLVISAAELADAAADKYGLPRQLVRSVMAAESGFQRQAISPKGAIGLMQLMPGTAAEFGIDALDPAQNVDAGVRYLRDLLVRYDYGLHHALAAYNAGPAAV